MDEETLADEAAILKMAWHPAHFDNDRLSAAAFAREDLIPKKDKKTNLPRFVSVDEKSCIQRGAVDERIQNQGAKDPEHKKEARFLEYVCQAVREMVDAEGENPLDVRRERLPNNPAHCGIHNVSPVQRSIRQKEAYADELRTLLIAPGTHVVLTFDQVFPSGAEPGAE